MCSCFVLFVWVFFVYLFFLQNRRNSGFFHSSVFQLKDVLNFNSHSKVCNLCLQELFQTSRGLHVGFNAASSRRGRVMARHVMDFTCAFLGFMKNAEY